MENLYRHFLKAFFSLIFAISITGAFAQTYSYSKGALKVNVFVSNPCDGATSSNGFLKFTVVASGTGSANLVFVSGPQTFDVLNQAISDGQSFTYTPPATQAGNYDFAIQSGSNTINTFSTLNPAPFTDLPAIAITQNSLVNNSNCTTPNGNINVSVSGGSKAPTLPGSLAGSFTYKWSATNSTSGLPLTNNNWDGTGTLDLTTLLGHGLAAGTYTLLITDNYSVCSQSQDFVITDPSPILYNTTTSTPTICLGSTGTVSLSNSESAVTYQLFKNGTATGITLPGNTGSSINFTVPAAQMTTSGTYNFTIQGVNGSCTPAFMNGTASVTVNDPPTTANAGAPQSICTTGSATLAANTPTIGTGAWSVTSGPSTSAAQFSNTSNPSATFTPAGGAGSYTLTWTITNAPCTASTSNVLITVNAPPTTANAGSPQTICANASATLAANAPVIGTGAWSVSSGPSTSSAQFSSTVSPTATFTPAGGAGTYTLTWTISNAPCTASTSNVNITVTAAPTTSNAGSIQTICSTSSATLAANTPVTGTGAWSVFSGPSTLLSQFSNATSPTATFTPAGGAGSYVLTWTISNAPCTPSASNVTITVNAPPTTSNAGTPQTICDLTSATLNANTPVVGTGAWAVTSGPSTSVAQFSSTSNPTATFTPAGGAGSYVLRWRITNAPCAASNSTVTITVKGAPTVANAGSPQTICATGSATLAANTPVTGTGAWSVSSGPSTSTAQFSSTSNPAATFTPAGGAGNYILTWTISNAPCIASTSNVTITVNGSPTVSNAGSDQPICSNGVATLAANTPVVGTGAWTVSSGPSTSATQFSSTSSPTATFTPAGGAGTYTLTWTISNAPCISSTSNVNINVTAAPTTANAGPDQTGAATCGLTTVTLAANTPVIGTGSWTVVSGVGGSFGNASSPTSTFTGTAGTSYTLQWAISNAPCTASTDNVDIKFNQAPSTSIAGSDQAICSSGTATLAANTPVVGTGTWTVSSGPSTSSTQFSSTSNPAATFTPAGGAGTYTLTWTISNAPCTASTSNINITVTAAPSVSNAGSPQAICSTGSATLAANTPVVGTGAWSISSGPSTSTAQFSSLSNPTATFTPAGGAGSYVLVWTISNAPCTSSTSSVTITVNAAPTTANAGAPQTICSTGSATLAANTPIVGTGAWSVSSGPSTSTAQFSSTSNPAAIFTPAGGAGSYVLTWTISNAPCTASTSNVTITVTSGPTAANAGPDQTGVTTCGLTTVTLAANTPVVGTGAWSIVSGVGGAFGNATSPSSTFTGAAGSSYTLQWTTSNAPCPASTDNVDITFNQSPTTSNAGATQTICSPGTVTLAANTPTVGTGAWSVSSGPSTSTAQFSSTSSPTATFTPAGGIGSYVLTWTISNAPCTVSTSNVTITVNPPPTASNAGSPQAICSNSSATLAANTPVVGTGAWSISSGPSTSTAQFSSLSNPAATFTPAGGAGSYVLVWTISNPSCTPSTSNVTITVDGAPTTSVAGPDQAVCGTSTNLAGNTPVVGVGAWSIISGAGGSVTTPASPTSTFTGTVGTSYTLRWTISNGVCTSSTDDVIIVFNQAPTTSDAGLDQAVCGTSATLAGNIPAIGNGTWSIVSGVGGNITTPSNASSIFTGAQGNSYTLRWTIVNGSCPASTDDVVITFDKNPTTSAAGSDQTLCGTATLAANTPVVGAGAWSIISGVGGNITTPSSPTSTFTGTAGSSYTLRWTISNGSCTPSTDDVNITFDQTPTTADAGADQSICGTNATLAGNTPTVGTGTWTIVSGAGGNITTPTSPTSGFTGTQGTTYTLQWTITSGSCTPSTDQVTITFDQSPTVAAAGSDQTVCGPATLAANAPVVGTGAWSIISGAGGSFSNASSPTSTFTGTGGVTYTIRWTISNGTCTPSTDDVDITFDINSPTPADAGTDQSVCGTSTILAGNTPVIGTGAWTIIGGVGGNITTPSSPTSGFTGTQGSSYTLQWTITNGACTPSTDQVVITFDQNPTIADAGVDQTGCGTITLAGNAPTIGTGAWTIVSGAGGNITTPASPTSTFTGTAGSSYTLQWTISNGSCAPSSDQVDITFDQLPTVADAGSDQSVCGTNATLAGNTPSVGTGAWTIVSGIGGNVTTPASPTSAFTGTQGNTYTLQWTIGNGTCTASTDQVVITLDQAPTVANAGSDQSVCSTATLAGNAPTVGTGAWTIVSGVGGNVTTPASPTSTFTGTSGTSYTLQWTISNGTCTASTDQVDITFDQAPATADAGSDQSVCGTSATLAGNTPTIGVGAWTIVSGAGGNITTPASATSGFTGTQGTTYTLQWTITAGTCPASNDQVVITFNQAPTTSAAGSDQTVCGPATLAANAPTVGTGLWSVISGAGGSFSDATSPTSTFSGTGGVTYTIRWTISNGGCTPSTDDVDITFDINTPTTANAGSDQSVCSTNATLAGNTPTVGTGTWTIISGSGGNITTPTNPTSAFTGTQGTSYTLQWTISNGLCTPSTDQVVINLNQAPTTADAGTDQSGCNTIYTLAGNTPTVGTGLWTIVSGTGGSLANASSPTSGFTGSAGNTYTLQWTISNGGCTDSFDTVTITINPTASCVNTGSCATVVITPVPSPAQCTLSNGQVLFNINPATPVVNNTGVKITITGISSTNLSIARTNFNDPLFPALPMGTYSYSIEYGDPSCVKNGQVTVDQSGTVGTPIATNPIDAKCFGTASGAVTLDVPGETGNLLEWSMDGINWTSFTAGNQITGILAGPAPTFQRVISVRRNASDPCNAQVMVTINNAATDILVDASSTDATCANNDGKIQINSVSGGTAPYTFVFDAITTTNNLFTSLVGGVHNFTVMDANGCSKNFPISVNFPGLVNFTTALISDPTCSGNGSDGSFSVTISDSGSFQAGLTTDPFTPPTNFTPPVASTGNLVITFPGLSKNTYYVYVRNVGSPCPTISTFTINGGTDAVDFNVIGDDFSCFDPQKLGGKFTLSNIHGAPNTDYDYQVFSFPRSNGDPALLTGSITAQEALSDITIPGVSISGLKKGAYEVVLSQNQTLCLVQSQFKSFNVNGPTDSLGILYVTKKISFPDLPTGSMLIGISESQEEPYEVRLELTAPLFPAQAKLIDWTVATRNAQNLKVEFNAANLFAGVYLLSLRDGSGCIKNYEVNLDVDTQIFIPNIFTPNGDEKNDTFYIRNLPSGSALTVTNRWGAQVFSSDSYDGTWGGGAEADGVYYYRLVSGGQVFTGWVEIMRGGAK